ncbi:MAG: DUF4276 family protein [Chloroflexi bacterium]|nr:DUF4276 family protein [Chloroflexota bacterium]
MPSFMLVLALYAEGASDKRFLPILIQRTAEQILNQRGRFIVEVLPPRIIEKIEAPTQAECILKAAQQASGYHALIIHADADHPTRNEAFEQRFQPGYTLVQQATPPVCKHLLPVIPVRMIEAWLLAHPEALQEILDTTMNAAALGLPLKAREVESVPSPKQTLKQAVQKARAHLPRRRQNIDIGSLYEPIARLISLERLDEVPAYKQFKADLTKVLGSLNLIE